MSNLDYTKARKLGEREYQRDVAAGKWPYLPALDEMLRNRNELKEEPVGQLEIPLALVNGTLTKGRQQSFASNYMPLLSDNTEFAMKWLNVLAYQEREGISDPVKAYEFMGRFYIAEGNKRVSVLKFLGQPEILADVIRIMPPDIDTKDVRIYREFLKFFKCTNFYGLNFSEEGSYEKLAEIFGMSLAERWPEELILNLKSELYNFSRLLTEKYNTLYFADEFLLYAEVFKPESLIHDSDEKIKANISLLRKEFNIKTITFSENPEPEAKKSFLTGILTGIIGKKYSPEAPLKIAFIYDGDPEKSRWINGHEQGRLSLRENFSGTVETRAFKNCDTSEKFDEAVNSGLKDGAELFITTSPVQIEDALRAAVRNPSVKFLNCSVHMLYNSVRTYCGRMYEAKFLQGMLAGILTRNDKIAYVSNYPLCGTVASINAFAIGASMTNPNAEILLSWSSLKSGDWHEDIKINNPGIIAGPDLPLPKNDDGQFGLYNLSETGVNIFMKCVYKWGRYYSLIIDKFINDDWNENDNALNYWWGMSSGVVDVEFSDKVPANSLKLINAMKGAIISGAFNPFNGELISQDGSKKIVSSTEEIVQMDWLNENVRGKFPAYDDLTLNAQRAVKANGLMIKRN